MAQEYFALSTVVNAESFQVHSVGLATETIPCEGKWTVTTSTCPVAKSQRFSPKVFPFGLSLPALRR